MASEKRTVTKYCDNSFNIWRILFTIMIMVFHLSDGSTFYDEYPQFSYHWYIAVEFFFVLSGYLLMSHAEKHPEESSFEYIKGRVCRLYPEYIAAFLAMVVLKTVRKGLNPIKFIVPNWLEALMLQSIGTNKFPYLNNPAWYVSALLIGSYIIYYLLKNYRRLYLELLGPVGGVAVFAYLYRTYRDLQGFTDTKGFFLNQAVLRSLLGLTIGIYVYLIAEWFRKNWECRVPALFSLVETGIFVGVPVVALYIDDKDYDFIFLILFAIGIFCASQDRILGKLAGSRPLSWLAEISYSTYMIHFVIMLLINKYWDTTMWHWWHIPVYIAVTIVAGAIMHYCVAVIVKLIKKIGVFRKKND